MISQNPQNENSPPKNEDRSNRNPRNEAYDSLKFSTKLWESKGSDDISIGVSQPNDEEQILKGIEGLSTSILVGDQQPSQQEQLIIKMQQSLILSNSNLKDFNFLRRKEGPAPQQKVGQFEQQIKLLALRKKKERIPYLDTIKKLNHDELFQAYSNSQNNYHMFQEDGAIQSKMLAEIMNQKSMKQSLMICASLRSQKRPSNYKQAMGQQFQQTHLHAMKKKINRRKFRAIEKQFILQQIVPLFLHQSYMKVSKTYPDLDHQGADISGQSQYCNEIALSLLKSYNFLKLVDEQILKQAQCFKGLLSITLKKCSVPKHNELCSVRRRYLNDKLSYLRDRILPRDKNIVKCKPIQKARAKLGSQEKNILHYSTRPPIEDRKKQNIDRYYAIRNELWKITCTLREIAEDFYYFMQNMIHEDFYQVQKC